jgi:hypothetical protein
MNKLWRIVLIVVLMVISAYNVEELEWFLGLGALSGLLFVGPGKFYDFLIGSLMGSLTILFIDTPPEIVRQTLAAIVGTNEWVLLGGIILVSTLSFALPGWTANLFAYDRQPR